MPDGISVDYPPVHPVLPGLRKSFFMGSKEQLEDIVSNINYIMHKYIIVHRLVSNIVCSYLYYSM